MEDISLNLRLVSLQTTVEKTAVSVDCVSESTWIKKEHKSSQSLEDSLQSEWRTSKQEELQI